MISCVDLLILLFTILFNNKVLNKYPEQFGEFQQKFRFERSEGQYNGVTIREILSSERVLEYLRTWREVPDNVRKAVVEYLKATWNVYLVSMQQDVAGDHQQVCEVFREKFVTVRKILDVSETVKARCIL